MLNFRTDWFNLFTKHLAFNIQHYRKVRGVAQPGSAPALGAKEGGLLKSLTAWAIPSLHQQFRRLSLPTTRQVPLSIPFNFSLFLTRY